MRRLWWILPAVFLSLAAPAHAAPEHAEIAFVSDGRIWSTRADGSERRLLIAPTRARETLSQPVWSPDGSTLAYVSDIAATSIAANGASRLMLFDGVGTRAITELRTDGSDYAPAWSPDGTALAFARFTETRTGYRSQVLTHVLATGAERILVSVPLDDRLTSVATPSWSPDGAVIAYSHSRLDRRHYFRPTIRTIAPDGGASRLLITDAYSLAWSPDGRLIALASIRDHNGSDCGSDECWYAPELYTAAADGSALVRLTRNTGSDAAPAWSPDGSRILFTSDRSLPDGDAAEAYSVAADGSCLTWLTNGAPASFGAGWRPGSGTRYDPGSCDPASRAGLVDAPAPPARRGAVWLGTRYRGLLLSRFERTGRQRHVSYEDCENFDPRACPDTIVLTSEEACRIDSFRGLTGNAHRFLRRRGALVAFYGSEGGARVMSGHAVTKLQLRRGNSLRAIGRVMRALRPFGASHAARRLPPPRVPRAFARRLESAARTHARQGTVERTARVLGIEQLEVRGRLRLRRALRSLGPYRFSSCAQPSSASRRSSSRRSASSWASARARR